MLCIKSLVLYKSDHMIFTSSLIGHPASVDVKQHESQSLPLVVLSRSGLAVRR